MAGFDSAYYLAQNKDVADAVKAGTMTAEEHYNQFGRAEGRAATQQGATYRANNPDVQAAIQAGSFTSAQDHFDRFGWGEGRGMFATPSDFDGAAYLEANKDVADAGVDPYTHYSMFGAKEGRNYTPTGKPQVVAPTTVPDAPAPNMYQEVNNSVENRLARILGSNSPLMTRARTRGLQIANGRGLLNSSMATGEATNQMIDVALPIASQDSSQGNQRFMQEADITSREGMQGRDIENQRFMQGADIASREGMQGRDIASREGMQGRDITSREGMQGADIASREGMQTADIENRKYMQTQEIENQRFLSTLDSDTRKTLATMQENTKIAVANMGVGAEDKQRIAAMVTTAQGNYQSAYATIINNTEIPQEARDAYLTHIYSLLNNQMSLIEGMYGVDLEWT
jgi:hypothetical protein